MGLLLEALICVKNRHWLGRGGRLLNAAPIGAECWEMRGWIIDPMGLISRCYKVSSLLKSYFVAKNTAVWSRKGQGGHWLTWLITRKKS